MTGEVNITKFNRPLGSSKTFQSRGGEVSAARTKSPFDYLTHKQENNRNIHDAANWRAGRVNERPTSNPFVSANNGMYEGMMWGQVASMGLQSVMGITQSIIGLVNSKPAGGGPAVLKSAATLQGANSAAITSMQSATTASDLRAAINNAETLASTLTSDIQNIEAELPGLKQAAEEAQTKINDLNNQGNWKERLLRKINEYIHISGNENNNEIANKINTIKVIKSYVDNGQFPLAVEELSKSKNLNMLENAKLKEWYQTTASKIKFNTALSEIYVYSLSLMKTQEIKNKNLP